MSEWNWFCGSCGVVFSLDEIEDMDDVKCPECGSQDVAGDDELSEG